MDEPRLPGDDAYWNAHPHAMSPEEYCRERNAVLLSGDWRRLKAWGLHMGAKAMPSDEAIEISFHQMVTAVPSLPFEARKRSWWWLGCRGYKSLDDGDLDGDQPSSQ